MDTERLEVAPGRAVCALRRAGQTLQQEQRRPTEEAAMAGNIYDAQGNAYDGEDNWQDAPAPAARPVRGFILWRCCAARSARLWTIRTIKGKGIAPGRRTIGFERGAESAGKESACPPVYYCNWASMQTSVFDFVIR